MLRRNYMCLNNVPVTASNSAPVKNLYTPYIATVCRQFFEDSNSNRFGEAEHGKVKKLVLATVRAISNLASCQEVHWAYTSWLGISVWCLLICLHQSAFNWMLYIYMYQCMYGHESRGTATSSDYMHFTCRHFMYRLVTYCTLYTNRHTWNDVIPHLSIHKGKGFMKFKCQGMANL